MFSKPKRSPYDPQSLEPYRLSRSKIDLFISCERCFYLDIRLGISQPPGFPFNLNSAVDLLLKKEFDHYRKHGLQHPFLAEKAIVAQPISHPQLNDWRNSFKGVEFLHRPTNLLIFGAIDDLWRNPDGEYVVVDYKATSSAYEIKTLDKPWHIHYKRQMEVYQWLLRQNGLSVSSTGYFFYCNGDRNRPDFNATLHFKINLIPYRGDDGWIEPTLKAIYDCLNQGEIPLPAADCRFCNYTHKLHKIWFTPDSE